MPKIPCDYLLKPGALLQAFSDPSKTCTNANLTNELAQWHLMNNPGVARYFSKIPAYFIPVKTPVPSGLTIIPSNIVRPDKIIIPKVTEVKPVEVKVEEVKPEEVKVPEKKEVKKRSKKRK